MLEAFRRGGVDSLDEPATDADGYRPEDWLASVLRIWTPIGAALSDEGLTRVTIGSAETTLRDLVQRRDPGAIGGYGLVRAVGPTNGILVKLLDAAQRLPVHCHPDRAFAERFLGSRFGKTEAWIVLGTRQVPGEPPPRIWLGFRRPVERDELRRWIDRQDGAALLDALHAREVRPGDVWLVPAGQPHAIGAGLLIAELQEPTDFSIVAETGGFPIVSEDAHLGPGWDVMVEAFDRRGIEEDELEGLRQRPADPHADGGLTRRALLGADAAPYFRAERVEVHADALSPWPDAWVTAIVERGSGRVVTPAETLEVRAGDCFGLPAVASGVATLAPTSPDWTILCCLPPEPDAVVRTGWRTRTPATA
jgi:mannose-6-phosphate isomerase